MLVLNKSWLGAFHWPVSLQRKYLGKLFTAGRSLVILKVAQGKFIEKS